MKINFARHVLWCIYLCMLNAQMSHLGLYCLNPSPHEHQHNAPTMACHFTSCATHLTFDSDKSCRVAKHTSCATSIQWKRPVLCATSKARCPFLARIDRPAFVHRLKFTNVLVAAFRLSDYWVSAPIATILVRNRPDYPGKRGVSHHHRHRP